jgi:hypothetical protein
VGLYVSSMRELPVGDRTLYLYLLDYGWPSGDFERLFRDNFGHLSQRASETGAVVVMSGQGVHFANEVLNWHHVCGHDTADILPALLLTHTHPSYFALGDHAQADADLGDIALIPLRSACTTPQDFLSIVGSVFEDLEKGLTLRNFRAEKFDVISAPKDWIREASARVGEAVLLQPNFAGIGIDLKKLLSKRGNRATRPPQARYGEL